MHEKDIGNPRFCIHTFFADTKTRIDLKILVFAKENKSVEFV
jgi:hypothetical protein